uniref:(California timema) hypothetical protein n=1 Tax=Timema californicum TaxID=61474 RepID=A0A7R9IWI9_TIMCA|nr:unnamed protein product [Timema californicum]
MLIADWISGDGDIGDQIPVRCTEESFVCPVTHFKCLNHLCVPVDDVCNFVDDCGDGSDEHKCLCLTLASDSHFEVKDGCKDSVPDSDSHFEVKAGCKDSVPDSDL